jgi:hypothetical protein
MAARVYTVSPGGKARPYVHDPWIERIAWLMDNSIPVGRWSIGLDGLLGLVPGFGDLAGACIAMIIVSRAVAAGVPRIAVARMMANIAIDSLLGTIPVLGDLFDFAYKANMKNLRIYEETITGDRTSTIHHWGFLALVMLVLLAVLAAPVMVIVSIVRHLG